MNPVSASKLARLLIERRIPVVLIGAKACNVRGSSRLSMDMDWAARIIDADAIIDLMYELGYRLPLRVEGDEKVVWAETTRSAKKHAELAKLGAFNFYFLGHAAEVRDQIDFVFENPIPFAIIRKNAERVCDDPELDCASVDHLILMKEKRLADGKGKPTDEVDLQFLRELRDKKKKPRPRKKNRR